MKNSQKSNPEDSKIKTTKKNEKNKKRHGIIIEIVNNFVHKSIYSDGCFFTRYDYPLVEYTFSNKMVNEDNQHFYDGWAIEEKMDLSNDAQFERVMKGLKPMCCIEYLKQEKIDSYIQKLDLRLF